MKIVVVAGALLLLATQGSAGAEDSQSAPQCTAQGSEIASLMEKTEVNAVMDYSGPPSEYKSDADKDTLEIVFLPKQKGVSSTVSENGEVIFLVGDVEDEDQQQLIMLAFCLRVVARRA